MSNGFKGKVKELTSQLDEVRTGVAPLREGGKARATDISLSEFIAERRPGFGIGHLYAEVGVDPRRTTVEELYADADTVHLMPEIIRDGVKRGMGLAGSSKKQWEQFRAALMAAAASLASPGTSAGNGSPHDRFIQPEQFTAALNNARFKKSFYQNLLAITETGLKGPVVNVPYFDASNAKTRVITEGETKPKGSVSGKTKPFELNKYSTGLGVTYEQISRFSLNMSSLFFADAGRLHAAKKNTKAVECLLNGDQADLSFAAAVIGVESTGAGFAWVDHLRVLTFFEDLDLSPDAMIASKTMALKILNLPEFKDNQNAGSKLANINVQTPLPTEFSLYQHKTVPSTKVVYNDSSISLGEAVEMPMTMQSEKIISRDIIDTYIDEWSGFWKMLRVASVVVNEAVSYAANPFPAWFEPVED
jgi:hypothetical protein